jgi:hypothetical protein
MNKRQIWLIALFILVTIIIGYSIKTGVNGDYTAKNMQRPAQVEIYSAKEHKLIKTIEDKETLTTFNKNTVVDDDNMNQEETRQEVEKYEPQYTFVSYRKPVALINNGDLEKVLEITTFKDTNMIMMQVSPDNIKNIAVPSEYLTFYIEVSKELITYLNSLVK